MGVYAFFFFFWSPEKEGSIDSLPQHTEETPLSELVLEELPEDLGIEEISPGVHKRRFLPTHSFPANTDPVTTQELNLEEPASELTGNESPDIPESSVSGSGASMPMLSFVGIDPDIRTMELPPSEEHTLDIPLNIGNTGSVTTQNTPTIAVNDNASHSLSSHFYNIPVRGNKILFIIEAISGWSQSEAGRILALENELQRVIDSLDSVVEFNIWVYLGNKIACCTKDFMPASSGNKAFSIIWMKSYFTNGSEGFVEEHKPVDYPSMYTSNSGLDWASPLFLAIESKPESIFLMSSSWKGADAISKSEGVDEWTDAKEASWQAALKETQQWIDEENQRRALDGIPPRAIFNIKQIVTRRHPDVQPPPALPRLHEDKIYPELKQRVLEADILNKCPIHVILHPQSSRDSQSDLEKFSKMVLPYRGGVYLVR